MTTWFEDEQMATYIVAVRRNYRGRVQSALDAVRLIPRITVRSADNPNAVMVDATPADATLLAASIGDHYIVEPAIEHRPLVRAYGTR